MFTFKLTKYVHLLFKLIDFTFRTVLSLQKNWVENKEFLYNLSSPTQFLLLTFVKMEKPMWNYYEMKSTVCSSMHFDKCIMSCFHHYSLTWNVFGIIFAALKISCAPPSHPSPSPSPWLTLVPFAFYVVLLFLESHLVRIR